MKAPLIVFGFLRRRKINNISVLSYNNMILSFQRDMIYYKIYDSHVSFASHTDEKLKEAPKGLGIIKTLSRYLSVKTLDQIYKMYVRPHLDFRDVIYHLVLLTLLTRQST